MRIAGWLMVISGSARNAPRPMLPSIGRPISIASANMTGVAARKTIGGKPRATTLSYGEKLSQLGKKLRLLLDMR